MSTPKKWHVFVSHATDDATLAVALAKELRRLGWNIFVAAEDIVAEVGSIAWSTAIDDALDRSMVLLTIATPGAAGSRWVEYEWRSFHGSLLSRREQGAIIPLCAGGRNRDDLERTLQYYQAVSIPAQELTSDALDELDRLIRSHVEKPNLPRRWSISFSGIAEPNLAFLGDDLGPEETKYIGIDAHWPRQLEKFIASHRSEIDELASLELSRLHTRDQLEWKATMMDGVRALAMVPRDFEERRQLKESFRTYLAAYSVGLFRYLSGLRPLTWDPPDGDPGLSGRCIPNYGPFLGGIVALAQVKRWEPIGWMSAEIRTVDRQTIQVIVPVGAIVRSCWLPFESPTDGDRFVDEDYFRFILPQVVDQVARGTRTSLRQLFETRPRLAIDERSRSILDSESYEEHSHPHGDWPRLERKLVSTLQWRPKKSANTTGREPLVTEALGTFELRRAFQHLSPKIERVTSDAVAAAEAQLDEFDRGVKSTRVEAGEK